jgi:hypothetical protein
LDVVVSPDGRFEIKDALKAGVIPQAQVGLLELVS